MTPTVRVGSFSPSVLLRVARRAGLLDEYAVRVEEIAVPSSPAQFADLFAGRLAGVLTSPDNVLAYRYVPDNPLGRTGDVRIVAAIDRGLGLALYGAPGRARREGLRGARLGVDVATSGFAFAMYALTASLGVARQDYEVVTLGSTPARLAALLSGACEATMLNAGNDLLAEQAGCPVLATVAQVCPPYLGTVLAGLPGEHTAAVSRVGSALRAAAARICAGDLAALTVEVAGQALGLAPRQCERYLERLRSPDQGLVPDGVVEPEALGTVVALRRRYLPASPEGVDLLEPAMDPGSGLLVPPGAPW